MTSTPLVTNIQKYAIHDGRGIRTTVFFKGCPLRCAWCHNPETHRFAPEWMHYKERCIGCGHCDDCPTGARTLVGRAYPLEELVALLLRDRIFYEVSGGGVTLSGGEVLAQEPRYILSLCKALHGRGVRVAVDTCGHAPYERLDRLLPYVESFLYDIKAMDPALHRAYTGVSNDLILENLQRLHGAGADIRVRIPVIPGVNDTEAEVQVLIAFLLPKMRERPVHLLPYHPFGRDKAERLSHAASPLPFERPTDARMAALAEAFARAGFTQVLIGG